MGIVDLRLVVSRTWKRVCSSVKNACVFMDDASAESLHWSGGLGCMLDAGALHVAELSPFERVPDNCLKAVFILASPFRGDVADTVRDLIHSSEGRLQYVVVVTAAPAAAHALHIGRKNLSVDGDEAVFARLEDTVLQWMGNANFTAEVVHMPFDVAAVTDDLFVIPGQSKAWPPLTNNYAASATSKSIQDDVQLTQLSQSMQDGVKGLVAALDAFLGNAGLTEECYYVGTNGRHVAQALASGWLPAVARRRKVAASSGVSVLLVDRALDLVACLRHDSESFLDRLLQTHARFPRQSSDIGIDMQRLIGSHESFTRLLPLGCLAPTQCAASDGGAGEDDDESPRLSLTSLDAVLAAKSKADALMECTRRLTEAAAADRLPVSRPSKPGSRVTPEHVLTLVELFRGRYQSVRRHCQLLQTSLAVCSSLDVESGASVDKLCQLEKVLMQAVGEGQTESAIDRLASVVQKQIEASPPSKDGACGSTRLEFSWHQLFGLTAYLVALLDDIGDKMIEKLKPVVAALMLKLSEVGCDSGGEACLDSLELSALAATCDEHTVIQRLRLLPSCRSGLQHHRSLLRHTVVTEGVAPATVDPLVKRLVLDALNADKPLPGTDIKHAPGSATGVTGLLKTGLGLFKSKPSAPHPSDKPILIVFVIGGVTASEVKQCRDAASGLSKSKQLIIGSTRLIADCDVVDCLLAV